MAIEAVDPTMLKLIVISFAEESESKNQHSKADPWFQFSGKESVNQNRPITILKHTFALIKNENLCKDLFL